MSKKQLLRFLAELDLNALGIVGRIALAVLFFKRAPTSPLYLNNPAVKQAADEAIQAGTDLSALHDNVGAVWQEYQELLGKESTQVLLFDKKALVFKTLGELHSGQTGDLETLGFTERPPRAAPTQDQPGPIEGVVVNPGKVPGSLVCHCPRMKGSNWKYEGLISDQDPATPESYKEFPGTHARRTVQGHTIGKKYSLKFRAVRGNKASPWSQPTTVVAR